MKLCNRIHYRENGKMIWQGERDCPKAPYICMVGWKNKDGTVSEHDELLCQYCIDQHKVEQGDWSIAIHYKWNGRKYVPTKKEYDIGRNFT